MALIPNLTFTESLEVSMDRLRRIWDASKERLPFQAPASVPFLELEYVVIIENIFPILP